MLYLISYDYGSDDKHAYHDLIKAKNVDEAIDTWRGSGFAENSRLLGVVPVRKELADTYYEKMGDKDLTEWFQASDRLQEISDTIARAVGTYEK